jgi:hypothetical protein
MPDQQSPQAPAPVSDTPDNSTPPPQPQAATPDASSASVQPTSQQPSQTQPSQQTQPSSQPSAVSNAPAANTTVHPSVQKAGIIREIAQTLAGGPRYTTQIDPATGKTTRTPAPLSRADILTAITMEAISGSLAGLSQRGPGATGRAAEAGFQQVAQQRQQADAQEQARAQQQYENQSAQLVRRAQVFEANSRAILNTSEAEARGADAIDKLVDINRQSGVLDVDPELLDNAGRPMTQDELLDAMKAGKLSPTDQVGPIAGRVEVTNPDGSKRWEATHLVVRDPSTPVSLTQDDWDRYAAANVPGFPAGTKIGPNVQIKLSMKQIANETLASHHLANERLSDLRNVLDGTSYAKQVPASVDFSKPGVESAMQRFQKYVSHNADNLGDPFTALQQMGTDKRDPKTGAMQPNPDAKYVSTIADAFGGWNVLQAAHDQLAANKKTASDFAVIDTADKANAVLSAPKRFTPDKVQAARNFITLSNEQGARKAAEDARARAIAEGTDVQAMYKYGRNPITGEQLSLSNAPDSMLVSASGQVVPQDMLSTYKPTAQERQTGDTARQVLAISAALQSELQKNPNLAGPLSGRSKVAISKLGYSDAQTQKFLDDIAFLQSASTKMHTGRFSNEILKKMNSLIQPGMNPDQFNGALSSINDVASRYADEDKLTTVADYKQKMATPMNPNPANGRQVQIPAGAQIGRDGQGRIVGYKLNGQYVSLGGNQQ